MKIVLGFLFISILISCNSNSSGSIFEKLDPQHTHISFNNQLTESEEENVLNYEYFYNGGGVAAADFNNDSLIDLFFTGNQVPNKLYLNKGNLQFEDITSTAFSPNTQIGQWYTGATVVDINQDGWQDIYVSLSANIDYPEKRRNKLFINQKSKDIKFKEEAKAYGLDLESFSTHASFFDYDKDGDLDVYILNHNVKDFKRFDVAAIQFMRDSFAGDKLMRNDSGYFIDVSVQAGIKGNPIGFGLGIHTADLNNDFWPDIYVSNDYLEEDYLYINNKNGTFTDEIKSRTDHISYFSMGNDIGDINNDLLPDIITTDMLPEDNKRQKLLFGPDKYEAYLSMLRGGIHPSFMRNMLHLNNGDGSFSEIGQLAGISNTDWTWSVLLSDFDNDGFNDLFCSNGYLRDYTNMDFMKYYADASIQSGVKVKEMIIKMPSTKTANYIFKNNGDLTFSNKQKEWNMSEPILSNGAVSVDLDNDGDLELITNNINAEASIFKNNTFENKKGNYIKIELPANNNYGTKVKLFTKGNKQYKEYSPVHGYQSSVHAPLHFGLGTEMQIDSILILWPDSSFQKILNPIINQTISIKKDGLNFNYTNKQEKLFSQLPFSHQHQQMPLNDFSRQLLIPHMFSYSGPRICSGDMNGDGYIDFYIGGGKGYSGSLFFQSSTGGFYPQNAKAIASDKIYTDTDATLIDIDNDKDLDLIVASGGYEYLENDLSLKNRIYINDGKGNFVKSEDALLEKGYADNVVCALDFDKDGDQDLLFGGGCKPQQYPLAHPSRLFRNENGKFVKIENPVLDSIAIINDIEIIDLNKDGFQDILAVGEWSGVLYLENNKGGFNTISNLFGNQTGMWNRIQTVDIDLDQDPDILVGNLGLNSQYSASNSMPLRIQYADFDGNGSIDPIMSYFIQGQSYPAYSKDELLDQLPGLKKDFISYESYSTVTTDKILSKFPKIGYLQKEINHLSTTLLINTNNVFTPRPLPIEANFAPVYAIAAHDLNQDGYPDLILAGNQTHARVRIGNIDANHGTVLINNTKGFFNYIPGYLSGLDLRGNVRDLHIIGDKLIVGINSDSTRIYKFKKIVQ